MISFYEIDWGDSQKTEGQGIPPEKLAHKYTEQGLYPISINLKDVDGITFNKVKQQSFKLNSKQVVGLWLNDNKEEIAIGSTATISGIVLLFVAFTEAGKYKLISLIALFIPLYTRIQKEDVLDQFVRGQIYGLIKSNPGVHYNHIMRELDIKNGTLSYHLYILEKTGMIKSRREGMRYRVFYPTDMKLPEKERYRLSELQLKILEVIKKHRGTSQKEIAKLLNEKHQTINYNIKILQKAGLIDLDKKGRRTSCFIKKGQPVSS